MTDLLNKLNYRNELSAKVGIYAVKYHPFSISFYRFDDEAIFCPTKITEDKNYRPFSITVSRTDGEDIYNWCMEQLRYINKKQEALDTIYENKKTS